VEVVLASGNRGKLEELAVLLEEVPVHIRAQSEFEVPAVRESGFSFIENAIIKARNAAAHSSRPALADDSGIAVDALGGAPGIYSARYAGEGATDAANVEKLLADAAHLPDDRRRCRFICVAAFLRHEDDSVPIVCQGAWDGRLMRQPVGTGGFGYDPVFWVPEHSCSSAQLPLAVKNTISHRARAMLQIAEALRGEVAG
jgi:XTP/dITP diphosphohydrolase